MTAAKYADTIIMIEEIFIYYKSKSISKEILVLVRLGERRWDIILKNGKKII